jgi:alpha-L-rhamnosidase
MALMLAVLVLVLGASPAARAGDRWITHPAAIEADTGHAAITLQFRHELTLAQRPKHLFVRVSADNRYVLYVNGQRIAAGPSRGDLAHWRYARLDLAPHLRRGDNVIAAEVWNDSRQAPLAQISARTGFLLTAEESAYRAVSSGPAWRARVDASRTVTSGLMQVMSQIRSYYVAGAPETRDGQKRLIDWMSRKSQGVDWIGAVDAVSPGQTSPWSLVRDDLPQMRYELARAGRLVRVKNVVAGRFPDGPVTIPPHSEAVYLVDAGAVQAAYPSLTTSGGQGGEITIGYTEALHDANKQRLTDRAAVKDGVVLGLKDTFQPAGLARETFEPLWWRVWRFAEIKVKTGDAPLRLLRFERRATGYPFASRGRFISSDPELNRIWQIGWDTVLLDAHETFMDTAYWEQLQYIGDTRIEALVAYAVGGDPRLSVQAIDAFNASRKDGLPLAAWPSRSENPIPPFALLWIGMIHDYWLREPDVTVVARVLPGARGVLDWYADHLVPNGLVGPAPGWEFIDWRDGLSNRPNSQPVAGEESCIISLMYLGALRQAAELEDALGEGARAQADRAQAQSLAQAVQAQCWSNERQLYANGPDLKAFSQHANVLAVLYDVAPKALQAEIIDRITVRGGGIDPPQGVTGVTYYFSFYLARALDHAGLADRYPELLATWRKLLAQNFTTWPETPDPSRSDSHAWSAHPTADLLALVAGVQPASAGFATVRVAPHLGKLVDLDAAVAHPAGLVETRYHQNGRSLKARIKLPPGVSGSFEWYGQKRPLRPGVNRLSLTRSPAPTPTPTPTPTP